MEIYLTDEELEREKSLFSPDKPGYPTLDGKPCNIREFVEEISEVENLPRPPSSC
jgi:hypothetical protein